MAGTPCRREGVTLIHPLYMEKETGWKSMWVRMSMGIGLEVGLESLETSRGQSDCIARASGRLERKRPEGEPYVAPQAIWGPCG